MTRQTGRQLFRAVSVPTPTAGREQILLVVHRLQSLKFIQRKAQKAQMLRWHRDRNKSLGRVVTQFP